MQQIQTFFMPVLLHMDFNKLFLATRPWQVTLYEVVATGHLRNALLMLRSIHCLKTWNGGLEVPGIEQVK